MADELSFCMAAPLEVERGSLQNEAMVFFEHVMASSLRMER